MLCLIGNESLSFIFQRFLLFIKLKYSIYPVSAAFLKIAMFFSFFSMIYIIFLPGFINQ